MVFIMAVRFVIGYYFGVIHHNQMKKKIDKTNNNINIFDWSDKFDHSILSDYSHMFFMSSLKISHITNKKEISALTLSIISVMFSYVTAMIFAIVSFMDKKYFITLFLTRLGIMIGMFSQFIFGFSIYNNLASILHNSIYQLSSKEIEFMKKVNIAIIASFITPMIYVVTNFDESDHFSDIIIVLSELPLFISEIVFVFLILRLYYVKVGTILKDLNNLLNIDEKLAEKAQRQLLDKLVQSMVLNLLFVDIWIFEIIVVIYANWQTFDHDESTLLVIAATAISPAMVVLTFINTLQAGFNYHLYQNCCKPCHNCCVKCIQCCIYKK